MIVMKFGGAALATPESFERVAQLICEKKEAVVVVVSAMGEMTDHLLELAGKVHSDPPKRERDMLITAGERISMALLAMALDKKGREAISFTGSQSGIITSQDHGEAEIVEVRPTRILEELSKNKIVIVAGFQGVSLEKEVTTLGRGGSDTSAVALAVSLKAERVEFYKDVGGIYSNDPKSVPDATLFPRLSFEKALEIGGGILSQKSILLASKNNLPLHVRSITTNKLGTIVARS